MPVRKTLSRWVFKTYELTWRLLAARRTVIAPPPITASDAAPPIFLIGCPRSGTTLLRVMLDSHPNLACPAETFFLLDLAQLWNSDDSIKGLQEMGYDREHVRRKVREFASYFFQGYAQSRNKPRVVEKTPHYVACLGFIEDTFGPDCQYLMLYRHPFDVVLSMANHFTIDWHPLIRRYVEAETDKRIAYCRFWSDHVAKMLEFETRHPRRCRRVRYEDLMQDAEGLLRGVFEFLGEPWSPDVLTYYNQQHDLGRGDRKALMQKGLKPSVGNWQSLDRDLLDQMWAIVGETASRLGYEYTEVVASESSNGRAMVAIGAEHGNGS